MTLTKADMAEYLATMVFSNKQEAKEFVDLMFEEISLALENGEEVKLSGFGNFELKDKKERPARNPKTGEAAPVSARRVVVFHPSHTLKTWIDENGKRDQESEE